MRRGLVILALVAAVPAVVAAQGRPELRIERADGSFSGVPVELGEGFAAVPVRLLEELGWTVAVDGRAVALDVPGEIAIRLRVGSPFFRWDGVVLQLTDALFVRGADVFVPLQLLTDFFPRRLPDLYEFDGPNSTLRAGDPSARTGPPDAGARPSGGAAAPAPGAATRTPPAQRPPSGPATPPRMDAPSPYRGVRVVIIDAGHGGADPGALGPGGIREKAVALGIALGIEEVLRRDPMLEVHMIRDDDTFVDLWERGQIATNTKGDRPGVFVSIHANSFPTRRAATGFETYFLSEARTEHERRVAAIENAPLSIGGQSVDEESAPDIASILGDLRTLDHQHWSSLLAEMVQNEMDDVHPGPNRGVKQGVLAVLTNALMPSILVEVGYLSNDEEGRLLGEASFQRSAAEAIAAAVRTFFERYPPGSELGGRGQR